MVAAGARDHLGAPAHGLDDGAEQVLFLVILQRGGFTGGAGDDQPVAAVIHQFVRECGGLGKVDIPVAVKGVTIAATSVPKG